MVLETYEWTKDAVCSTTDPELFFPEKGGTQHVVKSLCGKCSVSIQCLKMALDNGDEHGIWGGLNPKERRTLQIRTGHVPYKKAARDGRTIFKNISSFKG